MSELLIAVSALVAGVVVLAVLRRGRPAKSFTPNSRTTDGASVEVGLEELQQPSAITATATNADEPSVQAAPTLHHQEREEAPGPEWRDSAEPQAETSAIEAPTSSDTELEPERSPVAWPSNANGSDALDDDGDQTLNDERTRDDDALIPVLGERPLDAPSITTGDAVLTIGEVQPQSPVAQIEIEPPAVEVSPEGFVAVSADEGGSTAESVREMEPVDLAIELPSGGELDSADSVEGEEGEPQLDIDPGPEAVEDAVEPEGAPRPYRPVRRLPRPARLGAPKIRDLAARDRSLQMAIRLSFRAGDCQISLLAQRANDLPEQIEVRGRNRTELLRALQEDWYELKVPADLGGILRDGAAWATVRSSEVAASWTLSSRDIHVLGVVADFGGYVSTSRLAIGEDHVILCTTGRGADVLAALAAAGCLEVQPIDDASGVPDGWIAFRNVKPTTSVPATNDGDILDTLRPLANIAIHLEGGIKLDRSSWLEGHTPTIRITGDLASAGTVLIDDRPVPVAEDGICESPMQAELGDHTVWSSSASRTYRVVRGMQEWTPWSAHATVNATVCGGGVFPLPGSHPTARQVVVPAGDVSLIGRAPGAVLHCSREVTSRSPVTVAFPSFDPVWIIPRFPLRCDRRAARIIRISLDRASPVSAAKGHRDSQKEWSRLVLDAHRRKLIPHPTDEATTALWEEYERVARSIWRRLR